jgi:hypothetical protein
VPLHDERERVVEEAGVFGATAASKTNAPPIDVTGSSTSGNAMNPWSFPSRTR